MTTRTQDNVSTFLDVQCFQFEVAARDASLEIHAPRYPIPKRLTPNTALINPLPHLYSSIRLSPARSAALAPCALPGHR